MPEVAVRYHCKICQRPVLALGNAAGRFGICDQCRDRYRCVACEVPSERIVNKLCPDCYAGYRAFVESMIGMGHREQSPRPPDLEARLRRYSLKATQGLPLFEDEPARVAG